MTNIYELAAAVDRAALEGKVETTLGAHLADPVSVHHSPAMPSDGLMAREVFARLMSGNPMAAVIPDGRRSYGRTSVEDDSLTFDSVLEGTTKSGKPIRIANRTELRVVDGFIVKLTQHYDPESMQVLADLFASSKTTS